MLDLLDVLKENKEDFEFYPTTDKMLETIFNDIGCKHHDRKISLLDIGCGNCKIYNNYKDKIHSYYIIEKSKILLEQAPVEAIVVGTEFETCSLIDKSVDYIFCNPPYSRFEDWTIKILQESYAKGIYMIIPCRWKENKKIQEVIKDRNIQYNILDTTDFLDAERQARAKVDIINFVAKSKDYNDIQDPFDYWFENNFKFNIQENGFNQDYLGYEFEEKEKSKLNELILKKQNGIIEILVDNYNYEMQNLLNNYKKLSELDVELLKSINVDLNNLKKTLKTKIVGLKNIHWEKLVDNLDTITNRLTISSRRIILNKIHDNMSVDFNYDNAYAIVMWVIKQANKYYDQQLIAIFKNLTEKCNCIKYKSNKQTWAEENWRWNKYDCSHYILDYRIVVSNYMWQDTICDLITIANNLGFNAYDFEKFYEHSYDGNQQHFGTIYLKNTYTKDGTIFLDYKKYKNGNLHLRINKEFMKAFNIEASRLLGWVKNKDDVKKEFDCSINDEDIDKYFGSCKGISLNGINRLLIGKE